MAIIGMPGSDIQEIDIIEGMPIKIPSGLPARDILDSERIFALEKPEA